jgi:hypothetical protein
MSTSINRIRPQSIVRAFAAVAIMGMVAVAPAVTAATSSGTGDAAAFLDVLKASVKAENAKDAKTFLKLWTDKGLAAYDVGTRAEIAAGKSDSFGADPGTLVHVGTPVITGSTATVDIQATVGTATFAQPIYLVAFKGVKQAGGWLLDGFEFKGSPPPPAGTDVVQVTAVNYAFSLDKTTAKRNLAFHFVNKGSEAHELTFFKTPKGVTFAQALVALQNVDGHELKTIPAGYQVNHIGFAEPGQSNDVTFAAPLAAGDYALVCYIPKGGMDTHGNPKDPKGTPHVKLGMITILHVV